MANAPLHREPRQPIEGFFGWSADNARSNILHVSPGTTVFHEGKTPDHIYEILSGTLKLTRVTADGRQLILGFPTAGEVIGLSGSKGYSCTAETVDAVTLSQISRTRFQTEIIHSGTTAEKLFDWFNQNETKMLDHISLLAMHHPSSRIAAFLIGVTENQLPNKKRRPSAINLPMTQRDIATYLAIAPETYSRFLRKFRERGILKQKEPDEHGRKLVILDIDRLHEIASGDKM